MTEIATNKLIFDDIRCISLFVGIDLVLDRESRKPATSETDRAVNLLLQKLNEVLNEVQSNPHDG